MKKLVVPLTALCILGLGFFFTSLTSTAQNQEGKTPPRSEASQEAFQSLMNKAQTQEAVFVIIGLRVDFQPEGHLASSLEVARQRAAISQAQDALLSEMSAMRLSNVTKFEFIPFMALEVDAETLKFLEASPDVTTIEEDRVSEPTLSESAALVGAPGAWASGFTGSGQTVAILDTGVDKFHSFLAGKVVSEACYSTNSASTTSVCPGGVSSSTSSGSGVPCIGSSCNHGTHVAGIAAGLGSSFSGVAKNSSIIAVQVFTRNNNGSLGAYDHDIISGLQRVQALSGSFSIAAVNMSLGGGRYFSNCNTTNTAMKAAIDNLRSIRIATIIASGNNGFTDSIGYPACISSAISVGSVGDGSGGATQDVVVSTSNSASFLTMLAPGQWINSSIPGGGYSNFTGTSMAAPHVAGAWAVLRQQTPAATVDQVLASIVSTSVPVTDARNGITKPRLRLGTTPPCSTTPISAGQTVNGSLNVSDCRSTPRGTLFYTDKYTFTGTAGDRIAIMLSSATYDTYLYLLNSSGTVVTQDDDGGGGTNSRIPAGTGFFTLPSSGVFTIESTSYFSNTAGNYTLTFQVDSAACSPLPITYGQTLNGVLTATDCRHPIGSMWYSDPYTFTGSAGQQVVITMSSAAFDTWLELIGPDGSLVAYDNDGGGGTNSRIPTGSGLLTLAMNGTYTIQASTNFENATGAYTVSLNPNGRRVIGDFDLDRRSDIAVYRPSNGGWYVLRSSDGVTTSQAFGLSGDIIAPGDYDGDGRADLAVFRPSTGYWYLMRSLSGFTGQAFGSNGDKPAAGDYDGDGLTDIAVFRPSTGMFYIMASTAGFFQMQFGANGDRPVPGDYDGDGKTDIAVFRPSTGYWHLQRSSLGYVGIQFGLSTDYPAQGDYDGDGKHDVAVFRPSNGYWYVMGSLAGFSNTQFGNSQDRPAPGDYDGDGKTDLAVFRSVTGSWYLLRSQAGFTGVQFGANGDVPVEAGYIPQ